MSDELKELQIELEQVRLRMQLDDEAGRGWSVEDMHIAGELQAKINKILSCSEGSD